MKTLVDPFSEEFSAVGLGSEFFDCPYRASDVGRNAAVTLDFTHLSTSGTVFG